MPKTTTTSTLALAALLAAGTAGGTLAQTATTTDQTAPAAEAQATEGEAEVIIVEEGEEDPAEGEAAVVVEEEAAEDTVITTDPNAAEADAVVVEEAPAATDPAATAPVTADPAVTDPGATGQEAVVVQEVEEVEQPVQGQILEQSPDQVMAETLLDAAVISPEGETIGDVVDMVISSDGMIEGVVIGVGGFLGIGQRNVAMEFSQIEVRRDDVNQLTFILNATREQLENAPQFRTLDEIQSDAGATGAAGTAPAATGTAPAGGMATDPAATTTAPAAPGQGDAVIQPAD